MSKQDPLLHIQQRVPAPAFGVSHIMNLNKYQKWELENIRQQQAKKAADDNREMFRQLRERHWAQRFGPRQGDGVGGGGGGGGGGIGIALDAWSIIALVAGICTSGLVYGFLADHGALSLLPEWLVLSLRVLGFLVGFLIVNSIFFRAFTKVILTLAFWIAVVVGVIWLVGHYHGSGSGG
jgi:hypothetical protein